MTDPFFQITPLPDPAARSQAQARLHARRDRQQRSNDLRRAQLLDLAEIWVAEHGLAALNMRDLGAKAGYTAGALYSYFGSRDQLIEGLRRRFLDSLNERVSRATKSGKRASGTQRGPAGEGEGMVPAATPDAFERGAEAWWKMLGGDVNALDLLLHGPSNGHPAAERKGATAASPRLLEELCQASEALVHALLEEGMEAAGAVALQEQVLSWGMGLLVTQQPSRSSLSGRSLVAQRFMRGVQVWRAQARTGASGDNAVMVAERGAHRAQVDLFGS